MKTICHVGIMGDIRKEGLISQYIYDYCEGEHIYVYINDVIPKADIYILHCMKNLLYLENFIKFRADGVIISLLHSSEPCMPSKYSNIVVVLTEFWKNRMKDLYNINSVVIPGGIDVDVYNPLVRYQRKIKNNNFIFGKISRPEPGKFHKNWNEIIKNVLDKNKKSECHVICDGYKKLNYLKHKRMKWIEGIYIKNHQDKINELSKLDLYIELHSNSGSAFVDTFNMSMLEAMALGIPVLMLGGLQKPMIEVLGGNGFVQYDIEYYHILLDSLIFDYETLSEWGEKARSRAENFSHKKMIEKWNEILC